MRTTSTLNKFDKWSAVHFIGCGFLTAILYWIGAPYPMLIAFLGGVLWEIFDGIYYFLAQSLPANVIEDLDRIFDRRGSSWLDLVCDAAGCGLAGLIICII